MENEVGTMREYVVREC